MRRAIAAEFAALPTEEIKVIMTLDARLPEEAGPWRNEPIDPGEHGRKLRKLCRTGRFYRADCSGDEGRAGAPDPRA